MCRKKIRFWNKILFRMSIWVLLLGIGSILAVSYIVKLQMRNNIEKQITEDLQKVRENSEFYIRQILLLQNSQINEAGFRECISAIKEQLESMGYQEAAFYDMEGQRLDGGGSRFAEVNSRKDFQYAMEQKSAFTLHYGREQLCEVYFTMPVEVMDQPIGMISYYMDYAELYQREWDMLSGNIRITMLAFGVIYLVIWLMIQRMVNPVRRLSRISSEISRHLEDGLLDSKTVGKLKFNKRRDEIGELSRNYTHMIYVTKEQFDKIQEDRNHIMELWNSRQEFYNNVTHELKTPLTTISGYAQLMEENALEDEELFYNGMEHILQESTRLHRMVVQLLEMQDYKKYIKPGYLNAAEIAKSVVDTMQMKARRYENKLMFFAEEDCYIEGREDQVRQVLINLIDNAIKYGEQREEIQIQLAKRDGMVRIAVSNKGKGLTEEELKHIFEPFYRVDKERSRELGSSGLGLTISKKIMEDHKGSIQVQSESGKITVFTVAFPAASRNADRWEAAE